MVRSPNSMAMNESTQMLMVRRDEVIVVMRLLRIVLLLIRINQKFCRFMLPQGCHVKIFDSLLR